MSQLALPLRTADYAVFDSFWNAGNETAVAYLQELVGAAETPGCWLSGPATSGKTHLLQAVCERMGDRSVYLPLRDLAEAGPGILEGMALRPVVCIDDITSVAGQPDWEHALFDFWHQLSDAQGTLVLASRATVRESGFELADLQSRFSQLAVFQLRTLDENELARALQMRARHRGLELPDQTARYMLSRSRRDMASLYKLLDHLDAEALRTQRRLTVPFVKTVMPG
ncbi:MAG: DnaA regulatory inactivator Hda [Woeseia sp.]